MNWDKSVDLLIAGSGGGGGRITIDSAVIVVCLWGAGTSKWCTALP